LVDHRQHSRSRKRIGGGGPLDRMWVPSLPVGRLTIPATFNNKLGIKLRWNGSKVVPDRKPYDIIDFTKKPMEYRLTAAQTQANYNNTGNNGTFAAGAGYAAADTITLSDGSVITVNTVTAGAVATFTVTSGSSVGSGVIGQRVTRTQASTSGVGTGFTLSPKSANETASTPYHTYYVNYTLGTNAGAGTASGAGAWKTWDYALTNAVSPAVIQLEDDWIGFLSAGGTTGKVVSGKFKFKGKSQTSRTRMVAMREDRTLATFAWVPSGTQGAFVTTTAAIGLPYRSMFDRNYLDDQGIGTPLTSAASIAECQATPGTFYANGTTELYVHMLDNRMPDPADGWIYTQSSYRCEIQQALLSGGIVLFEDMEFCSNNGTAGGAALRYRQQTTGSADTCYLGLKNIAVYGPSGNALELYDASVQVLEGCATRWTGKDGFNHHSFVTTGTKGEYITVYVYDSVSQDNGNVGFYDQYAGGVADTSSNAFTCHDSIHIMRWNIVCDRTNGASIADVNGCHSLLYNAQVGQAIGTASPRAGVWHDRYGAAGTTQIMYAWGLNVSDGGDSTMALMDTTGQADSGLNGDIRIAYYRGQLNGKVGGASGNYKDWSGAAL